MLATTQPSAQDTSGDSNAPVETGPAEPRKRRRVKTGCLTCRARKVKCDETHPRCNNCCHLEVECKWAEKPLRHANRQLTPSSAVRQQARPAGPPRPSTGKAGYRSPACFTCRYARSKCSQSRPSCARCLLYGHECKYPESKAARSLTSSAQSWMKRFGGAEPESEALSVLSNGRAAEGDDDSLTTPNHVQLVPLNDSDQSHEYRHSPYGQDFGPRVDDTNSLGPYVGLGLFPTDQSPGHGSQFTTDPASGAESNATATANFAPSPTSLPSQDRIEQLAVSFFQYVHVYRANAFLHREKTLNAIREGTLSETIVLALCAVGARFAAPPESDKTTLAWATETGTRVMAAPEATRDNVAASLLLTIYMQQSGRYAQSHIWSAVANSQAISLGLHRESPPGTKSFGESERDRRLFFACYAINGLISNGTPESIQCPASRINLRLPCDGFNYRMDIDVETPYAMLDMDDTNVPKWMYKNVGAMGFWVRLIGVRVAIKRFFHAMMDSREALAQATAAVQGQNHALSQNSVVETSCPVPPWNSSSPFAICMDKLASIRESLPPRLQLSRELVIRRHDSPVLGQIVMFYLWWNECHIELCSIVLPGYPQSLDDEMIAAAPTGWLEQTRQSCLRHAHAITEILAMVEIEMLREPLVIHDHTIAHAVYLSMRVQLELAVPNPGDAIARSRMEERFEMMLKTVERTSVYFWPVYLVLKEMRRMLVNHEMSPREEPEDESRPETPPLPWFKRQKKLDSKRLAEKAAVAAANLEAIILELLPDWNACNVSPWNRGYDVDTSYNSNMQPQTSAWDSHNQGYWMGNHVSGPNDTTPINTLLPNAMDKVSRDSELPRFDPFLPKFTPIPFTRTTEATDFPSQNASFPSDLLGL